MIAMTSCTKDDLPLRSKVKIFSIFVLSNSSPVFLRNPIPFPIKITSFPFESNVLTTLLLITFCMITFTISYTFLKDTLGAPKLDATDTIATALAAIIGSPLLVIGQALEQAENTIQGISNLSARKKMEYLKYCLAILQYLESENALVE